MRVHLGYLRGRNSESINSGGVLTRELGSALAMPLAPALESSEELVLTTKALRRPESRARKFQDGECFEWNYGEILMGVDTFLTRRSLKGL